MSTECKCTNPDGGGTKCPSQHIAVCIRERDGQCYGECVPIPEKYGYVSDRFTQWLEREINHAAREFVNKKTDLNISLFSNQSIKTHEISNYTGQLTYYIGGTNRIFVRFLFEFSKEQRGGLRMGDEFNVK